MKIYDVTDEFIENKDENKKKNVKFISESGKEKKSRENIFQIFMNMTPSGKKIFLSSVGIFILISLLFTFLAYSISYTKINNVKEISEKESIELNLLLDSKYSDKRTSIIKSLPYSLNNPNLNVWAASAILVDASNGCILYEKNADQIIPPASIAKLFVMYIVFKDAAEGKISLDDLVTLPERSWAVNMPKDASLMFLGQGHIVTLRELLKGLAVASGNDAALAIADYISGSTKAFVERMNEECKALGLKHTHFVEPSGYDENNLTTARELAAFCTEYIKRFPNSVEEFHSAPSIKYPLQKNLPSWQKDRGDSCAVYQKNTNPLLGLLEGCDGIKTGFIYESRYNLALTAKRNGVRFISITMMGTGQGTKQGNEGRIHDGTEMMEWAFSSFADYTPPADFPDFYSIPALASKNTNGKFVKLVPAWKNTLTVPNIYGKSPVTDAASVKAEVNIPKYIYGGVKAGQNYGQIQYKLGDTVLETVPLVADRSYEKSGLFGQIIGKLVSWRL